MKNPALIITVVALLLIVERGVERGRTRRIHVARFAI